MKTLINGYVLTDEVDDNIKSKADKHLILWIERLLTINNTKIASEIFILLHD